MTKLHPTGGRARRATGSLVLRRGKRGDVWYAKLRRPAGGQRTVAIGPAWTKRGRCPEGHLTRGDAHVELRRLLTDVEHEQNAPARAAHGVTFRHACDEFLRHREVERGCAASTMRDYRLAIDRVIAPGIGADTPLADITDDAVTAFRDSLLERGLAAKTRHKHMVTLHGILDRARKRKWIEVNPAADVERVKIPPPSGQYRSLEPAQVFAVAAAAKDDQTAALIVTAALSGLRQAELAALRWRDVDFAQAAIHVERSLPANGGGYKLPKSGRVRSVPLLPQVATALSDLFHRGIFTGADDHVFVKLTDGPVHRMGAPLSHDAMRDDFYAALAASGLGHLRSPDLPTSERFTFHHLRHTFGTQVAQVAPLADVQAWMGHAHITTTMIYVHHRPRHDDAAKLGAHFADASVARPAIPDVPPIAVPSLMTGRSGEGCEKTSGH